MKLADLAKLSLPGRIAAAVVMGTCGIASVVWAYSSLHQPVRTHSPSQPSLSQVVQQEHPENAPEVAAARAPVKVATRLDLNTATQAELELLPGVGPALSKRIIEYRDKHGRFETYEDLDKVSGIGPKMLEKIRPLAEVRPPAP